MPGIVCCIQRLSEHVVSVGSLCGQLSEEYQLQYSGWCTALANCDSIIRYVCDISLAPSPIHRLSIILHTVLFSMQH